MSETVIITDEEIDEIIDRPLSSRLSEPWEEFAKTALRTLAIEVKRLRGRQYYVREELGDYCIEIGFATKEELDEHLRKNTKAKT